MAGRSSCCSTLDALNDHLHGSCLRFDLENDLFTVMGRNLTTPAVLAIIDVDPANGGVWHEDP